MSLPAIRSELHYGDRLVRCFAERPADIDAMVRAAVARAPAAVALVEGDKRISYRELDAGIDAVAGNLARRGLAKGDRLALLIGNRAEFVLALLGAARIGVIVVPMNIRQRSAETEFVLQQCAAAALIHDAELAAQIPPRSRLPALRDIVVVGSEPQADTAFERLLTPAHPPRVEIAEEDVFCLLYTSGTTGRPKGAKLTHLGTVHSVLHYQYAMQLGPGEVSVLAVPASHVTGLVAIILSMLNVAGTIVMLPQFKAPRFLQLAASERMSYTLIVPAMYNLCLLEPDFARVDLSAWRTGGFGGAPMPPATIARLAEALPGLTLLNIYGSTETTSPCTLLPPGHIARHPDSVGLPLPCADVLIVDEAGRELPRGQSGELWIGGPMTVPGYWDNPEADATGFAAGYWRSGDIGSMDADGYVRVFDRKKDMINRGGFKVYCIEVENVLSHHPGVIECAVVGVPDAVLGERVRAFVVPREPHPAAEELRSFCAERLSDYKVPEVVTFLDTPLPRNANGKVVKTVLRDLK